MKTAVDDYLTRQAEFDQRIAQTRKSILYWRQRGGLAPGVAVQKVKDHTKLLEMLEWQKQEDCLPWER